MTTTGTQMHMSSSHTRRPTVCLRKGPLHYRS